MKKFIPLFFILLFTAVFSYAQNQNDKWYFGWQAGLNFSSGTPVTFTNSAMMANEGSASISDASGNLQFYTDGVSVWNKNNIQMSNGFGLNGNFSSTQSALIVPKPQNCNIYYIFTVPAEDTVTYLCYSVVDMSLNGGLGDVVTKNISLHRPVTERLTGTLHSNGRDYWVAAQEYCSNAILSYHVSPTGVDTVPTITSIPSIATPHDIMTTLGYMKISGNGAKLAFTYLYYNSTAVLLDFDNTTGAVSNPLVLNGGDSYGLEFSPDNSKLYLATANAPFTILQYDLAAGSPSAIQASMTTIISLYIVNLQAQYGGALQLGPDGKIYADRLQKNALGVINNPNLLGTACNYVDTAIYLGGKICLDGLPNFLKNYSPCSIQNGIEEPSTSQAFNLAPNPVNDVSILTFSNPKNENCSLYIYNTFGQRVRTIANISSGEVTINRADLVKGLYFLTLVTQNKQTLSTGKMVIE